MYARFIAVIGMTASVVYPVQHRCFGQGPATLENLLPGGAAPVPKPLVSPEGLRLPVPSDEDVAAAQELIQQAYEEDYAAASFPGLFDKLLRASDGVKDDTRRYALLVEAERAAIEAGDIQSAIQASDLRSRHFEINPADGRLQVLVAAAASERKDNDALFAMFISLAKETIAATQLDVAEKAIAEAIATAKRIERSDRIAAAEERKKTGRNSPGPSKAAVLLEQATGAQKLLRDRKKAKAEYEAAVTKLKDDPDDPAANGLVGRYRCFVIGEWSDGLLSLQASDSERLRKVAGDELRMRAEKQPTVEQQLSVAGEWWKVADAAGMSATDADAIRWHAVDLYRDTLPSITDPIERALANKRIGAMTEKEPSPGEKQGGRLPKRLQGPRGPLQIPASALLPAPAELSPQLVAILPTEAEVAALLNHVNVEDRIVGEAKNAYLRRVYATHPLEAWTASDAVYLIGLNDKLNEVLGQSSVISPRGYMSGSRESCKAYMAAMWLLKARNEQDFVARFRSLPADTVGRRLEFEVGESESKEWLMGLGPEYTSARRKLQAIEFLIKEGVASAGMRRYGEELAKALVQP